MAVARNLGAQPAAVDHDGETLWYLSSAAGGRPVHETEQPLAQNQRRRLARQPVRAYRHETVVADVEGFR